MSASHMEGISKPCICQSLCCVPQIRMLGEEGGKDATGMQEHGDDVFLKKIESHLLTQVKCHPISVLV